MHGIHQPRRGTVPRFVQVCVLVQWLRCVTRCVLSQMRLRAQLESSRYDSNYVIVFDGGPQLWSAAAGIKGGHPFVLSSTFSYLNSDGSTDKPAPDMAWGPQRCVDRMLEDIAFFVKDTSH